MTSPRIAIELRRSLVLSIVAVGVAACAPEGPGCYGMINLGPAVDPTAFQTLAFRTFANPSGSFDPGQPVPHGAPPANLSVAGLTFPRQYRIGTGSGTIDTSSWLFVAWLSQRDLLHVDDDVAGLDPGDVYCSVPYQVTGCKGMDGDCGLTANVDCILATAVPAR